MKSNNTDFYSQSSNFVSYVSGGVDPRTGLFKIQLPLVNLHTNALAGPALSLTLNYDPLSETNNGFGIGFNLNLTSYDTNTGKLLLSSGEEYRVDKNTLNIKQHKLKNFIFNKIDDTHCAVTYKSGQVETLSKHNNAYIPSRISGPDGRSIFFKWDSSKSVNKVSEITDDLGNVLCAFTYPTDTIASTKLTLYPSLPEETYSVVFHFNKNYLISLNNQAIEPSLEWSFSYDDVGPENDYHLIVSFSSPTGTEERVEYYTEEGIEFPEIANLSPLPCVYRHIIIPGGEQPRSTTIWEWTSANYLGKDAGMNLWQPDSDQMLNILLTDYFYGSTEKHLDTDDEVLRKITRRYNSYHLLVSEITESSGKQHILETDYHALPGVQFDNQPAQYALPVAQTEVWKDNDANSYTRETNWQYDNEGNPLYQQSPDGTETIFTYYSSDGEGEACPADPFGFTRYLKTQLITPRKITGDEPDKLITKTWTKLNRAEGYCVVENCNQEDIGLNRTVTLTSYYDDMNDSVQFGRKKQESVRLYPDSGIDLSFLSTQDFSYELVNNNLKQSAIFTGHDGLVLTRSTLRHINTGLLISQTNAQNVTSTFSYDKIGRIVSRTNADNTEYQETVLMDYSIEEEGPTTKITDFSGNQKKLHFDGLGRKISEQIYDADHTQQWYNNLSVTFNSLGEELKLSGRDFLTTSSQYYTVDAAMEYDGWRFGRSRSLSDGTIQHQEIDPILHTKSIYMQGMKDGNSLSTGKQITHFDELSLSPVLIRQLDTSGNEVSNRKYVWDGLGRLVEETDESGNTTQRTYDSYNRLLTQTLPDGTIVSRTYPPHLTSDQIATIGIRGIDAEGQENIWQLGKQSFDSIGRLVEQIIGGRTTSYHYTGPSPLPDAITLSSGKQINYKYVAELNNAVSSVEADDVKQSFTFDKSTGKILQEIEGDIDTQYIWNKSGTLAEELFSRANTTNNVNYTSTLSGEPATYGDITGSETTYERDEFGRVVSIIDTDIKAYLEYDALGRLSAQTVVNSLETEKMITEITYDDLGREATRTIKDNSGAILVTTLTWKKNGLLETRELTVPGGEKIRLEKYDYDNRNRLVNYSVSGPEPVPDAYGNPIESQAYTYDALNNLAVVTTILTDKTVDITTFHFENEADPTQLTSLTHTHLAYPASIRLEYDAEGRMTRDEAGRSLNYDTLGRLISVDGENISGGTYDYDANNRLVSQKVSDTDVRQLYYRGNELVNEVSS